MADRVKGITIEINGDTTGLSNSLSGVNKEIKSTQSQLKDVERLLKLDPTNTELLTQKQNLLAKSVKSTSEKLESLKEAEKQAQVQFAKGYITEEQYNSLKREIIATENSLESLKEKAKSSNAELSKIGAIVSDISSKADTVAQKTKALSTAAAGLVVGLAGIAYNAVTASDDLNTLANQSGLTTSELQKMQFAADLVDVSVETITSSLTKMRRNMISTSSQTQEAWATLGVSVTDATGQLRDSSEVFYDVLSALSRISNETERDTLAMQLFGKSADQLAGIIDDGGAGLKEYGDQAERMGLILSQDTLDALNEVNDKIDLVKATAKATLAETGAKAMEALLPVFDSLIGKVSELLEWVGNLNEGEVKLLLTVTTIVATISPMAKLISNIGGAINTVVSIIPKMTDVFTLSNAKIALVVAGIAAFVMLATKVKDAWSDMSGLQKAISVLGLVATAALTAAIAVGAFQSASTMGIAAAGIVAGIAAVTLAVKSATNNSSSIGNVSTSGSYGSSSLLGGSSYSGGSSSTYNYNFNVDNISTYQQIEQKLENQRMTTRMGYVGG